MGLANLKIEQLIQGGDFSSLDTLIKNIFEGYQRSNLALSKFDQVFLESTRIKIQLARENYGAALAEYQKLFARHSQTQFDYVSDKLFFEDVRANYGNTKIQYGRQNDDENHALKKSGAGLVNEAIENVEILGYPQAAANYKNFLWSYHYMVGEYGQAQRLLQEAEHMHRSTSNDVALIDVHHNSSVLYGLIGEYGESLMHLQKAL